MTDRICTADLCDRHAGSEHFQIADPMFRCYGGKTSFWGSITTLKVFEDNVLLRQTLEQSVEGRVLVVDGGGSHRCALFGEELGRLAVHHGWQGVVIYGCIRDSAQLGELPIGVRALHTHPLKSHKRGHGERDTLITFAGVNFRNNHYIYADEDGVIVSPNKLL